MGSSEPSTAEHIGRSCGLTQGSKSSCAFDSMTTSVTASNHDVAKNNSTEGTEQKQRGRQQMEVELFWQWLNGDKAGNSR